jgi:glycosyltransferase involved in cell wall biosynthesis
MSHDSSVTSPRRPKVLRAIARLNVGGPARHAVILEHGLRERGFETLLVHGTPTSDEGSLEELIERRAVRAIRVPGLGRRVKPWSDLVAFWSLLRLISREKPDILHTHTAKAGTLGRLAGIAFNLTRRRARRCLLVHTFHGHVLSGYFGMLGTQATRYAERLLGRWTDRIVTISDLQREEIGRKFRIASMEKISVIPLGLELDDLLAVKSPDRSFREALDWNSNEFVVGYVGRLVAIKDVSTLLTGFAGLLDRCPRARLVIVGDGVLRESLEKVANDLRIGSSVRFAGWKHDLASVYGAMDVVALTSRNEGTPVALIEAMAAGVPVVATAVGGVPDVVKHNENGLLIPSGEPMSLADALYRVASDDELCRRLGAAGRREVALRFRSQRLVDDVAGLYSELLNQRRSRGLEPVPWPSPHSEQNSLNDSADARQ